MNGGEYMGVPFRTPRTSFELAAMAEAEANGLIGQGECTYFRKGQPDLEKLPCTAVPLADLAVEAMDHNKHAQRELGRRYEQGIGLPIDLYKAEELYKRASETGVETFGASYVAGIGGAPGHYDTGTDIYHEGLPEARPDYERLRALRLKREGGESAASPPF